MPNSFLQYCAYICRDPYATLKVFWEMPLSILWQLIHCELQRNGVDSRWSLGKEDAIGLIRDIERANV